MNQPQLRFEEFNEDWTKKKLGQVGEIIMGQSPDGETYNTVGNGTPLINGPVEFTEKYPVKIKWTSKPTKFCRDKDILFCVRGSTTGRMNIANDIYCIGRGVAAIRANTLSASLFIELILIKNLVSILRFTTGSTFQNIDSKSLIEFQTFFPALPEQQKIATFLTAVDEKIQALQKKKILLEQYKKGIMQKLFSQQLRFKNADGSDFTDWEEKKLGDVAEKRILKNKDNKIKLVFTNSALQGIVNQRDFFDKDIANQNNLLGYYVVEKNDFVYNPRISSSAPVGPISRNYLGIGIMSPLYSVFRFKKGNLDFINYFFNSSIWHEHMEDISNYGARDDRMSFSSKDFYEMPINFPSLPEQTIIANFLLSLDEKIKETTQQINHTQVWKKGLLQKMFC